MGIRRAWAFLEGFRGGVLLQFLAGSLLYFANYYLLSLLFSFYPAAIALTLGRGSWWLGSSALVKILYVGIFAPFFEELVFRRGILGWFASKGKFWLGMTVSSALFGIWHLLFGWGVLKAVDMALVGAVFGFVYGKYGFRGSLASHYANNFWVLVFLLVLV